MKYYLYDELGQILKSGSIEELLFFCQGNGIRAGQIKTAEIKPRRKTL